MIINNSKGVSLISSLMAMAVFSIGFMSLTSVLWSSAGNLRTTWSCDQAVMAGQDVMEILSVIDIADVDTAPVPLGLGCSRVKWEVLNPADVDNDGRDDFKTIMLRVYHSQDNDLSSDKLRMLACLRRKTH